MTDHQQQPQEGRLTQAYDRMLERVRGALEKAEHSTAGATLQARIDDAMDKAVELGELSREEAVKIAGYLQRDLAAAGEFLADTGRALREWLRFDLELIERRLWEMFERVADQTRLGILRFEERLAEASQYHTGEVAGIGTLRCTHCGKEMHFHQTGHIPPCPACKGTSFTRIAGADPDEVDGGDAD